MHKATSLVALSPVVFNICRNPRKENEPSAEPTGISGNSERGAELPYVGVFCVGRLGIYLFAIDGKFAWRRSPPVGVVPHLVIVSQANEAFSVVTGAFLALRRNRNSPSAFGMT